MQIDRKFYIYALYKEGVELPFYIGKGNKDRYKSHWQPNIYLKGKSLKSKIINKAIKENIKLFSKILEENLTEKEAFIKEKEAIKYYGRIDNNTGCLANHTDGGEGVSGIKLTQQCIEQRSKKLIGIPRSQAVKEKISRSLMGHKVLKTTINKIRKAKRGRTYPKVIEANRLIAKNRIGIPLSLETKLKISLTQRGRIIPKTTRKKISKSLKRTYQLINPNNKTITIHDLVLFCKQNHLGPNARNCLSSLSRNGFYIIKNNGKSYTYTSYKGYKPVT